MEEFWEEEEEEEEEEEFWVMMQSRLVASAQSSVSALRVVHVEADGDVVV